MKNFENVCLHMWRRRLAGHDDEDANAVQQRRPHDRPNQKYKRESDNERKPFNRQTTNSPPSASRQSTPRDKKSGRDETKQNAGKKKGLICCRCGGKGHPDKALPVSG